MLMILHFTSRVIALIATQRNSQPTNSFFRRIQATTSSSTNSISITRPTKRFIRCNKLLERDADYSMEKPSDPYISVSSNNIFPSQEIQRRHIQRKFNQWGVHARTSHDAEGRDAEGGPPTFPFTFQSVAQEAYQAITHTLYNQCPLDPKIASNAMSQSVSTYRPVKHPTRDVGRIGIEIDSPQYMILDGEHFVTDSKSDLLASAGTAIPRLCDGSTSIIGHREMQQLEERALRRFALVLAAKLSQQPWEVETTTDSESSRNASNTDTVSEHGILVAVYFNTMHLTIMGSQELQNLKRDGRFLQLLQENRLRSHPGSATNSTFSQHDGALSSVYNNIVLCCLGQDGIPEQLLQKHSQVQKYHGSHEPGYIKRRSNKEQSKDLEDGIVDPTRGMILVVQPTEQGKTPSDMYDSSCEALQRLSVMSMINGLPMVVISPRLSYECGTGISATVGGIDSSGYELSSHYGGKEPPRPGPWLLRDFTPPVYAWVGAAKIVSPPKEIGNRQRDQQQFSDSSLNEQKDETVFFCTRIALSHSVMDEGHPWHLFAATSASEITENTRQSFSVLKRKKKDAKREMPSELSSYRYLASTMSSSGRPDRDIIETLLKQQPESGIVN